MAHPASFPERDTGPRDPGPGKLALVDDSSPPDSGPRAVDESAELAPVDDSSSPAGGVDDSPSPPSADQNRNHTALGVTRPVFEPDWPAGWTLDDESAWSSVLYCSRPRREDFAAFLTRLESSRSGGR